jgi:hypothetical protein
MLCHATKPYAVYDIGINTHFRVRITYDKFRNLLKSFHKDSHSLKLLTVMNALKVEKNASIIHICYPWNKCSGYTITVIILCYLWSGWYYLFNNTLYQFPFRFNFTYYTGTVISVLWLLVILLHPCMDSCAVIRSVPWCRQCRSVLHERQLLCLEQAVCYRLEGNLACGC